MAAVRLKSRRRNDQGFKWARVSMALLATVGAIDTGSITLKRWGVFGSLSCPGGADGCEKVLNSPWGTLFANNNIQIPLSFAGLIAYLSILIMAIIPFLPGLSKSRNNLSRNTWWGLFYASCSMTIFSMILIGIMVYKINSFCLFCLLSALISSILLVISLIGGAWDDRGKVFFRGFILSLIILIGGLLWSSSVDPKNAITKLNANGSPPIVRSTSNKKEIDLARYLKLNNVVMYSAYWCPHCHDQKEMFGKEAIKELSIIECAVDGLNSQSQLCDLKGITGYPSWEINGKIYSGIFSLEELADLSGYKNF